MSSTFLHDVYCLYKSCNLFLKHVHIEAREGRSNPLIVQLVPLFDGLPQQLSQHQVFLHNTQIVLKINHLWNGLRIEYRMAEQDKMVRKDVWWKDQYTLSEKYELVKSHSTATNIRQKLLNTPQYSISRKLLSRLKVRWRWPPPRLVMRYWEVSISSIYYNEYS